jgi:hypothetical protein
VPSTISALTALTELYVANPPPIVRAEISDASEFIVGVWRGPHLCASRPVCVAYPFFLFRTIACAHADSSFHGCVSPAFASCVRDQNVTEQRRVQRDHSGRHLRTDEAHLFVRPGPHAPPASFNLRTACCFHACVSPAFCVVRVRGQSDTEQRVHRDRPGRHLRTDEAPCSVRPGPLPHRHLLICGRLAVVQWTRREPLQWQRARSDLHTDPAQLLVHLPTHLPRAEPSTSRLSFCDGLPQPPPACVSAVAARTARLDFALSPASARYLTRWLNRNAFTGPFPAGLTALTGLLQDVYAPASVRCRSRRLVMGALLQATR